MPPAGRAHQPPGRGDDWLAGKYLETFPGAIIAVSHDRYFLDRLCTRVFAVEPGGADFEKLQALMAEQTALEQQLEEKTERWMYLTELAEKIARQA